ncbi:DNA adenine methylase [Deferribacterales bacterium RsTz2092]|nr:DNA methyltransferase [Deferribacterales bacterium]
MRGITEAVSPLRYPGGKSRAIKTITPLILHNFTEFREPFVGGGSVFLSVKQNRFVPTRYIINDLNYDLYCFWSFAKNDNKRLYDAVYDIKRHKRDGREIFNHYTANEYYSDFERAVRFFVLNRITFSGTVDSGGYSEKAFQDRFTSSSIERILALQCVLADVEIRNQSYEELLFQAGDNVFLFLDPPYHKQAKSRLYGIKGNLHTSFDHEQFAHNMKKCRHKWLITLDNSDKIKNLFDFAYINEWELQYGMNNYKQEKAALGKELFISNYKISMPVEYRQGKLPAMNVA